MRHTDILFIIADLSAVCMFQLRKENYDFFPLDRALSLASMGKDATETKLDDLLSQVTSIVEKQRMEVGVCSCGTPQKNASHILVPVGLPSCGGAVPVYVLNINQPSLPTRLIL